MKILIFSTTPINEATKLMGIKSNYNGAGWMTSLIPLLSEKVEVDLTVLFMLNGISKIQFIDNDKVKYYAVPFEQRNKYTKVTEKNFKTIIDEVKPNIIHIFGTEGPTALTMINAANDKYKVVVQITGLVSIISKHYLYGIPYFWQNFRSIGDLLRNQGIKIGMKNFRNNGLREIEILKRSNYVIGKTSWDRINLHLINPKANYYKNNEILRTPFYENHWKYECCEKHSIFMSQGTDPIKGMHYAILAMSIIIKKFPDAKLYVAGGNIVKDDLIIDKIKMTGYGAFIKQLIIKFNLQNNVFFIGNLDEDQMAIRCTKSNVFIVPSLMENESNSLSEAKLVGVPCIASYVGGVVDRIEHGVDGFLYNFAEYNILAYYICLLFENIELAKSISIMASKNASATNNSKANVDSLIKIYGDVINNE